MSQLSFKKFIKNLEEEYEYHKDGGTPYKQETAKLSLQVANKLKDVDSFLNPFLARRAVTTACPTLEKHRVDDVAKMLRVIAKDMYIKENSPDDLKQYVQEKMQISKLFIKNRK